MASASVSTWAGVRYTSSGSEMLGSDTSAIGLYGSRRARTAAFITLPMIWAAFTTVAGARGVVSSLTHAGQSL